MALIDLVKVACDRLADHGWRDLLLHVTGNQLDIRQATSQALRATLLTPLNAVVRSFPGFVDFAQDGQRGITPGLPGRSLLYHAFASPGVTVGVTGPLQKFPTLKEIEAVENLVFGIEPPTLAALAARAGLAQGEKLTPVVFAFEYRGARDTCARTHADLAFSRTGIARVGTKASLYDPQSRGFQADDTADPFAFRVCPARYGVFLSVMRKGSVATAVPMRRQANDQNRTFWVPVHKLFDGNECLSGADLKVTFKAFHYNDKIRRVQVLLGHAPAAVAPFQLTTGIAKLATSSSSCRGLLMPEPHARLVEPARFNGTFLTYRVPPAASGFAAFEPGAQVVAGAEVRPAPAYVHARTEVRNGTLVDLGADPTRPNVLASVSNGNYDALHYVDFTGEGQIDATVKGLTAADQLDVTTRPAYSLVGAPDFFPSAGQREMTEWARSPEVPPALRDQIWGVPPEALCDTRLPANLQMPSNKFDATETTITAVVPQLGGVALSTTPPTSIDAFRHSCLPDDAAGVFAPGWDVSTDKTQDAASIHHLAAYGLGSPFPEDSKLCAALSTFWPAVAPDITRGMSVSSGNQGLRHTVAPLTDEEIGQLGVLPWDGNAGPKVVTINGQAFAECASFLHVDYVQAALEGRFTSRLTGRVTSREYQRRILAMAFVYAVIGGDPNELFVLSFRQLQAGDSELQQAQIDTSTVLRGAAYRIDLFRANATTEQPSPTSFRKRLLPITSRRFFIVDPANRVVLQRRASQPLWARAALNV